MSNNTKSNGGKSTQDQKQLSQQKLIQDLDFSIDTLCNCLSTLQSIILFYQQKKLKKKMWQSYDRFDFRQKSINELRCQFQLHLYLFHVSRQLFSKKYHKSDQKWRFPAGLKEQIVDKFLNYAHLELDQYHDKQIGLMVLDLKKIIRGNFENLNYQEHEIKEQQKSHGSPIQLISNGAKINQHITEKAKKALNYQSIDNIEVMINQDSEIFKSIDLKNLSERQKSKLENQSFNEQSQASKFLNGDGTRIQNEELTFTAKGSKQENEANQNIKQISSYHYFKIFNSLTSLEQYKQKQFSSKKQLDQFAQAEKFINTYNQDLQKKYYQFKNKFYVYLIRIQVNNSLKIIRFHKLNDDDKNWDKIYLSKI